MATTSKVVESATFSGAPQSNPASSAALSTNIWLVAFLVLACGLRFFYAAGQSITFDEYYEIQLAKESIPNILLRGDGFPPLYSVMLHFWNLVFGSETGRVFSIFTGTLGCYAIFCLGKTIFNPKVGLWCAATLSMLPIHLFYTSEIRAYALLLALTTFALNSYIHAIRDDRWADWLWFGVLTSAGLHTHYLFAIFPAMTLLLSLLYVRSIKPYFCGAAILISLLPLVLFCMQADFAMQQDWAYRVNFGIGELAFTYGSFLMGYTLGPSLRQLHVLWTRDAIFYALPWASFFLAALSGILLSAKKSAILIQREVHVLVVLGLAPLLIGFLCKATGIGFQVRYTIWALIPIVVLISYLIASAVDKLSGRIATGFLFGLFVIAMVNRHYVDEYRNADLQAVSTRLLDNNLSSRHPLLVVSGYMVEPFKFYLSDSEWNLFGIPMSSAFENRKDEMEKLLEQIETIDGQFWLAYTREFHEDPDGVLLELIANCSDLEFVSDYAGVRLYRGRFSSKKPTEKSVSSAAAEYRLLSS